MVDADNTAEGASGAFGSSGAASVPSGTRLRVAVVGAGIEGLTTAWFLQERGCEVTVFERGIVGSGSSYGNAGWLTPSLVAPLPEPSVLGFGLLNVFKRDSPLHITLHPSVKLWRFLIGFLSHCFPKSWRAGTASLVALNSDAIDSFERMQRGGVDFQLKQAEPFLACFAKEADSAPLIEELKQMAAVGQDVSFDEVNGIAASKLSDALTGHVSHVVRLHGQHFVNPVLVLRAVADSVRSRGGSIVEHATVTSLAQEDSRAVVDYEVSADVRVGAAVGAGEVARVAGVAGAEAAGGSGAGAATAVTSTSEVDGFLAGAVGAQRGEFDVAVLATGAWLSTLARPLGVKVPVQAGRGYSFSVATQHMPAGPVYLPKQRVACTPLGDRLRVAGMMEFKHVDAPLDPRRILAIADAAAPFLRGIDFTDRQDEWVGGRPCTPDGLPLVGATRSPRVFVNGGYGMWGVTLGPLCGRLLADQIIFGTMPVQLKPLNPLR